MATRDPELGEKLISTATEASTKEVPSSILECNVSFRVKQPGKVGDIQILQDVSAKFKPGTCTALMGPSGAGKSTLLNALCGRLQGELTGTVKDNGTAIEAHKFKNRFTFIPQSDILWASLTVRQLLEYTAELRLALPAETRSARVHEVMADLGLSERADVLIGDDLNPSLSGGQKKRVSIAMELLADRPVLFVDEPTSGLDSVTADEVCQLLCDLAKRRGKTIVCTIHQPTWEMLKRFHSLLLLARGRVCYRGAVPGLVEYMVQSGEAMEAHENPIDKMFTLIRDVDTWADRWMDYSGGLVSPRRNLKPSVDVSAAYPISRWRQATILLRRTAWLNVYDKSKLLGMLMRNIFVSLLIGLSFWQPGWEGGGITLANAMFMIVTAAFMNNLMATVVTVPLERAIVQREYLNGTYSLLAWWYSRVLFCVLMAVGVNAVTTPIAYFMLGLPAEPARFLMCYGVISLMSTIALVLAFAIGCGVRDAEAAVQSVPPPMMLFMLYAGTLIPKGQMKDWFVWIYYINPLRYANNIYLHSAAQGQGDNGQGDALLEYFSIHDDDIPVAWAVLGAVLLATMCGGYFLARRALRGALL